MRPMNEADLTNVDHHDVELGTTDIPAGRELVRLEGITKVLGGHTAVRDVSTCSRVAMPRAASSSYRFACCTALAACA